MYKKRLSDATKFTLAISLVLLMLLSCITVITVFNAFESREEAEAASVPASPVVAFSQYSIPLNQWAASGSMTVDSVSSGSIVFHATGQYGNLRTPRNFVLKENHKYLFSFYLFAYSAPSGSLQVSVNNGVNEVGYYLSPSDLAPAVQNATLYTYFFTPSVVGSTSMLIIYDNSASGFVTYDLRYLNLFDVTDMFGVGNEPDSASEFFTYVASQQSYPFYDGLAINNSSGIYSQIFSDPSYSAGFDAGYTRGSLDGQQVGYSEGFQDGYDTRNTIWSLSDGLDPNSLIGNDLSTSDDFILQSVEYEPGYYLLRFSTVQVPFVDTDFYVQSEVGLNNFTSPVYFESAFTRFIASSYLSDSPVLVPDSGLITYSIRDVEYGSPLPSNLGFFYKFTSTAPFTITLNNLKVTSTVGFNNGYDIGYTDGYNAGSNNAYWTGYNQGASDHGTYSFLGLMGAVIDAPIQAILKMLDFNILGINLQGFYLSLFTLCIVITVIKFVLVKN